MAENELDRTAEVDPETMARIRHAIARTDPDGVVADSRSDQWSSDDEWSDEGWSDDSWSDDSWSDDGWSGRQWAEGRGEGSGGDRLSAAARPHTEVRPADPLAAADPIVLADPIVVADPLVLADSAADAVVAPKRAEAVAVPRPAPDPAGHWPLPTEPVAPVARSRQRLPRGWPWIAATVILANIVIALLGVILLGWGQGTSDGDGPGDPAIVQVDDGGAGGS